MALDAVAEVSLRYRLATGVEAANVLHFARFGGYLGSSALLDLANEVADIWTAATFKDTISANCNLEKIIVRSLNPSPPAPIELAVGVAGSHGSSVDMPGNVTLAVKLLTASGGRSARGRVYHPALSENQCVADGLAGGVLTSLLNAWDSFRTGSYPDTSSAWGVASKLTGTIRDIVQVASDGVLDSQRRRLAGRGA